MFQLILVAGDSMITISEQENADPQALKLICCDLVTGKQRRTPITFDQAANIIYAVLNPDSDLPYEAANRARSERSDPISTLAAKQRGDIEKLFEGWEEVRPIS